MRSTEQLGRSTSDSEIDLRRGYPAWDRVLMIAIVFALLIGFAVYQNKKNYTMITDRQTADIAQIARNIAEGEGFVTRLVRPFNIEFTGVGTTPPPELNHAPLYPYVLAVSLKLQGISDQAVSRTSLLFLLLTAAAVWLLGRILFDLKVGLLAASILMLSAPTLSIGSGGKEWMMAAFVFTLLLTAITKYRIAAEDDSSVACTIWLLLSSVLAAALYYVYYPLAFLTLPLAGYYALVGERRWLHPTLFLGIFTLIILPACLRNATYTGSPVLGVSAWDVPAGTSAFPGDTLYRTTDASAHRLSVALLFPIGNFSAFCRKLVSGSALALNELLGMLGWLALPLAITSMLYAFRDRLANSVRALLYVLSAICVGLVALFGTNPDAVVMLAPVIAVYACAYLVLMVQSKKMPDEFRSWIIGGFVLITAAPALAGLIWPNVLEADQRRPVAEVFFADNAANVVPGSVLYTDVPWTAAWRTLGVAVWVPLKDDDVYALGAAGFPMQVVILTPESGTYAESEVWYMLHKVPLWRDYIRDPEAGIKMITSAAGLTGSAAQKAKHSLERFQRGFTVSEAVSGFRLQVLDPLATDDIQVLLAPNDR